MAWFNTKNLTEHTNTIGLPPLLVTTVNNVVTVTMVASDRCFQVISVPLGGTNVNLVAASDVPAGTIVTIQKFDGTTRAVTFTRAGADTINGATTLTSTVAYQCFGIMSDGVSKWTRVS